MSTVPVTAHGSLTPAGFTLIEMLVAMALGLVILAIASDLLISSSRTASDLQGRNDLLQESQIAQNYIVAQLREAVYVFPDGSDVNLGAAVTTARPGGSAWRVGSSAWP
ncbi:prepilin-type N-terminal cleavage/methylation domain-containing protein, partial [Deinococcus sp.]|uniref:PilW family protein n=1 Tax=Deinococcus sp. TaxID=47478 RepID=UPI002869DF83